MWKHLITLTCGVAIGVLVDRIVQQISVNKKIKYSKILEDSFGEPMYTNTLTTSDVRDWSRAREESLNSGCKIVVTKAMSKKLKEIGMDIDIGKEVDNYLILALVDEKDKEIKDSLLIKYENIEDSLKEQLEKGDGTMVIGG